MMPTTGPDLELVKPIAEIVESSTRQFTAEVYEGREAPAFGSWVQVQRSERVTLYALVSHVQTGSLDARRRATAYGKSEDELRREMPHVLELIRTTFDAQILAYRDPDGSIRQTLPPQPAKLHQVVSLCSDDLITRIGRPFDFLRTLALHPDPGVPADDLIVAVLRQVYRAHGADRTAERALIDAGRALIRLLDDDHERLHSILRRVH